MATLNFGSRGDNDEECKSSWDTHENNFNCLRKMLPQLDQTIHALITDLHERGLAQDVAVYIGGEMGRTPRVGQSRQTGRPRSLAAGGLQMGQVIGRTDKHGGASVATPYTPQNVLATLCHVLGIDPATTLPDHSGRPMYLLDNRDPIAELV